MAFVAARCTQCGASIQVDETKEAGICQYCGMAFVTEKVINNYNVTNNIKVENATFNVSGANIDNLLIRALEFEANGEIEEAKEYYNRILDIDAHHKTAKERLENLKRRFFIGSMEISREKMEIIESYVRADQKLEAIKQVRLISGLGLKDAKDYIDNFYVIDRTKPQKGMFQTDTAGGGSTTNTTASGGCYVATAVYGSYDCPQVWTLRRFRDFTLVKSWYGRAFIRTYYAISPTLVKWFGKTEWFRKLWKAKLDKMVTNLQGKGFESTPYEDIEW